MTPGRRLVAVGLLATVLTGLCIWYGSLAPAPELGAYPGNDDLASNHDRFVGERASIGGTVQSVDPVTIVLEGSDGTTRRVSVTNVQTDVETGDKLRAFVVVESGGTVHSLDSYRVPRQGLWYAWGTSLLAALCVLVQFLRHWQIEVTSLVIDPRAEALSVGSLFGGEE